MRTVSQGQAGQWANTPQGLDAAYCDLPAALVNLWGPLLQDSQPNLVMDPGGAASVSQAYCCLEDGTKCFQNLEKEFCGVWAKHCVQSDPVPAVTLWTPATTHHATSPHSTMLQSVGVRRRRRPTQELDLL